MAIDINALLDIIEKRILDLGRNMFPSYSEQTGVTIKNISAALRDRLQDWVYQFANGSLSDDDLRFLIAGNENVLNMDSLLKTGISVYQIDQFKQRVIEVIIDTIILSMKTSTFATDQSLNPNETKQSKQETHQNVPGTPLIQFSPEIHQKIMEIAETELEEYGWWIDNLKEADKLYRELLDYNYENFKDILGPEKEGVVTRNTEVLNLIWRNPAYGRVGIGKISLDTLENFRSELTHATKTIYQFIANNTPPSAVMSEVPLSLDGRGDLKALRLRAYSILSGFKFPSFFTANHFYNLCNYLGISLSFPNDAPELMNVLAGYFKDDLNDLIYHRYIFPWIIYDVFRGKPVENPISDESSDSGEKQDNNGNYPNLFTTEARLHSDDFSTDDKLEHGQYAQAIYTLISEKQKSPPPLNIAIIAPWGQGKTSLMRKILEKFESKWTGSKEKEVLDSKGNSTVLDLWKAIGISKFMNFIVHLFRREVVEANKIKLQHPTVWFNPWRYQSSEQLWAGLGHSIITQLVEKLSPLKRELFWIKLRIKRLDTNAIRRDINIKLFEIAIPWLIGFILLLIATLPILAMSGPWFFASDGAILLACIGGWLNGVRHTASKSVEGKFAKYVKEPEYLSKAGLYHQINEDLTLVFNELVDKDSPAIIFIDDLDRCSPKVVVEVIEALNLMMTSDFKDRCYFVIGMDAQMVSAALDSQYNNMTGRLADHEKVYGSIGWYFLDKFIQLPIFIPVLNETNKKNYLVNFFNKPKDPNAETAIKERPRYTEEQTKKDVSELFRNQGNPEFIKEMLEKHEGNTQVFTSLMTEEVMEDNKDSLEIISEAQKFSEYLGGSPRGLKRFVNLLRFYHTQQSVKAIFRVGNEPVSIANTTAIAKWLVIVLRWPQLVRWIQWEHEDVLINSCDPYEKSLFLDSKINEVFKLITDKDSGSTVPAEAFNKAYGHWVKNFENKPPNLKWLLDKDLFKLLYYNNSPNSTFELALANHIW